ncbi:Single-strand binding protein family protein [Rhizobiales bacterium GAS113]|nr:Single-strand binding protein family protein [Rhizobiales bacterium GAS113]SDR64343.1 Single-strand binding protein family protein [Rhizobiales bacterium GAS113]
MRNIAEFQIIGRVGKLKRLGSTIRVSLAANYPFKDKEGEWKEDPHWNEVTIFQGELQDRVWRQIQSGDLVHARGRIKQNSYVKDDETRYTVDLICNELSRLAKPVELGDDGE